MRAIAMSLTIAVALSFGCRHRPGKRAERAHALSRRHQHPGRGRRRSRSDAPRGTPLDRGAHRLRQRDERLPAAGTGLRHDRRGQRGAGLLQRQSVHLRRNGNRRGWARSHLQRARLPRVSPERRDRRREPDRRASHGALGWRRVLRIARRLARPFAGNEPRDRRARALRGHDPHVPHLDEHARRGLHRGGPEQAAPADPRQSTGRDARQHRARARARSQGGNDARRAVRLEEPAREPQVVLRRRLSQRDGHH